MSGFQATGPRWLCVIALLFATAHCARAATVMFSGSQTNVDAPVAAPDIRCGGRVTVQIGNGPDASSTGLSTLGSFTTTQSHCLTPPLPVPYDLGQFVYTFAGGSSIFGTYSGVLSATVAPGIFSNVQSFLVTGGTGDFVNASGSFVGIGAVNFVTAPVVQGNMQFAGMLNLPAVPEPSQWVMIICGIGAIGSIVRRRSCWARVG